MKPEKVDACRRILNSLGYDAVTPDFDNARHHHIEVYIKPSTPLAVEIHYRVAYGLGGAIFPVEAVWETATPISLNGHVTALLSPTDRLILNTFHALVSDKEFLNGNVSLRQLAEFSILSVRYYREIDWSKWYQTAVTYRLKSEFSTYLDIAVHSFGVAWPDEVPKKFCRWSHRDRITGTGNFLATLDGVIPRPAYRKANRNSRFYYYHHLPVWYWRNACYEPQLRNFAWRIFQFTKKLFNLRAWGRAMKRG